MKVLNRVDLFHYSEDSSERNMKHKEVEHRFFKEL